MTIASAGFLDQEQQKLFERLAMRGREGGGRGTKREEEEEQSLMMREEEEEDERRT